MKSHDKIYNAGALKEKRLLWKQSGERVVFTNGCFDLIHPGHVDYLEKASELGDKLIIGLNSDQSVRSLKGANRPLLDENGRAEILAGFFFVDAVVVFDENDPGTLIKEIVPDILVKGGDYTINDVVGKQTVEQNGGRLVILPFKEGYSTSTLINKIRDDAGNLPG